MPSITAQVPTTDPARLINRLCKHFSHKTEARCDETGGELEFTIGHCRLTAQSGMLRLSCRADSQEELDELGDVVASHLLRFAGGEVDGVPWQAD